MIQSSNTTVLQLQLGLPDTHTHTLTKDGGSPTLTRDCGDNSSHMFLDLLYCKCAHTKSRIEHMQSSMRSKGMCRFPLFFSVFSNTNIVFRLSTSYPRLFSFFLSSQHPIALRLICGFLNTSLRDI